MDGAEDLYLRVLDGAVKREAISLSFIALSKPSTTTKSPTKMPLFASQKTSTSSKTSSTPTAKHVPPPPPPREAKNDKSPKGGGDGVGGIGGSVGVVTRSEVTALVNIGQLLYEHRGDVMSAEECLREAVRASPQHVAAHVTLATVVLRGKEDAVEAETLLKTALKIDPYDVLFDITTAVIFNVLMYLKIRCKIWYVFLLTGVSPLCIRLATRKRIPRL